MATAAVQINVPSEDTQYLYRTVHPSGAAALHIGRWASVALMVDDPNTARRLAEALDHLATDMDTARTDGAA